MLNTAFEDVSTDEFNLKTESFECVEKDNLNVHCENSSDFIIGKQTNFNGPVTIINCQKLPDRPGEQPFLGKENEAFRNSQDETVIRGTVITAAASSTIQDLSKEKEKEKENEVRKESGEKVPSPKPTITKRLNPVIFLLSEDFLKIPLGVWLIAIVLLIGLVISITVELTKTDIDNPSGDFTEHGDDSENSTAQIGGVNIISKTDWKGLPARVKTRIRLPVAYVVISHTAGRFCYSQNFCQELVRNIQKDQMSRDPPYDDIAYSFLVGGDGNIYEGRGWHYRSATNGFANNKNVNINFIGDFSVYDIPTLPQVEAVQNLISYGTNMSYIAENYTLIAANSTYATLSPGRNVYSIIKEWPHFNANPKDMLL